MPRRRDDLPQHLTARRLPGGTVHYYYQRGGKKIPLGTDRAAALVHWARIEGGQIEANDFSAVAERYRREALPTKSYRTQRDQGPQLDRLIEAFRAFTLDDIRPVDVRQYLDRRTAKIAANREIALLSHLLNWARERGLTDQPNPCAGVRRHRERPRRRYVTDAELAAVRDHPKAPAWLRDALDLIVTTGQRPSDVLRLTRAHVRDGLLAIEQAKTGARIEIRIVGDLARVIERCLAREGVPSLRLIADLHGQPITIFALDKAFRRLAGEADWQLRDLRAKVASDAGDLRAKVASDAGDLRSAQRLLGHASEATTASVYRRVRGNQVDPAR